MASLAFLLLLRMSAKLDSAETDFSGTASLGAGEETPPWVTAGLMLTAVLDLELSMLSSFPMAGYFVA
jgi:hypothetical protein